MEKKLKKFIATLLLMSLTGILIGCTRGSNDSASSDLQFINDETATKLIAQNYTHNSQKINHWATGLLAAKLQDSFDEIQLPENTLYGSVIEYMVSPNRGNSEGYYYANFLNLSKWSLMPNTMVTNPAPIELYEKYKDLDWSNAYILFWMYNATDIVVSVHGTGTDFDDKSTPEKETWPTQATEGLGKKVWAMQPKTWRRFKISLKTYCNIASDVIGTGEYNIKLWLSFQDERVTSKTCTGEENWKFYLTGFEFVEG